jgi:hypothetical protein
VAKNMHESLETHAILQRMEEVRCELDEDVQEIVEGARVMGEWRYYVRTYPWICLGAALAGGYLVVPCVLGLANASRVLVTPNSSQKTGVRGALLTFAGNLVLRGVLSYARQQAGKFFAPPAAESQQDRQP